MKLTKNTLSNAVKNAGISSEHVKIMYNWKAPDDLTSSEYMLSVSNHNLLFNNSIDGLNHFSGGNMTKLLAPAYPGISIGTSNNALSDLGYGTFSGTDVIRISKNVNFSNWSVIINFKDENCPSDPSKRKILLNSTGTTPTEGFNIGINGAKNLFYEFYDVNGVLRTYTMLHTLNTKNIIAVTRSSTLKSISIYIFNPIDFTVKKFSVITKSPQLGSKWLLGGASPAPASGNFNQRFVGTIYEFIVFSESLSEGQIIEISKACLPNNITVAQYQTITETYYPADEFTEEQVQVGTTITGETEEPTTIENESGNTQILYDIIPITSPVYRTVVTYIQSTTPSTREIQQLIPASVTYDYEYIKEYAPTCVRLLENHNGHTYELYTSNQYNENIGKEAQFASGEFIIDEDYDNEKIVVIYINGLLSEEGVDYTRDGIIISKYSGDFTENDYLIYDVIDEGSISFSNYAGGTGVLVGQAGKDLYLNGLKLIYGEHYQDSGLDISIISNLSAGKIGILSAYSNTNKTNGPMPSSFFMCLGTNNPIISEILWISGIRQVKDKHYYINNPCDLNNSDLELVDESDTIFYNNDELYFNI